MKKKFLTGIRELDDYLGNIEAGEVFLTFLPSKQLTDVVVPLFAMMAREEGVPLAYAASSGEHKSLVEGLKRSKIFNIAERKRASQTLERSIISSLSTLQKNSFLLLDDLSTWKELLNNERRVVELYRKIIEAASKRGVVVIASAVRSEFSLHSLALLKESATIVFEILQRDEHVYFIPLVLRNRYSPLHASPLCLNASNLSAIRSVKGKEDAISSFTFKEDSYAAVFQESSESLALFERGSTLWDANSSLAELLGYQREEFLTKSPLSFVTPSHKRRALRFLAELPRRKRSSVKLEVEHKKGKTFFVEVTATSIGKKKYLAVVRDLSAMINLEEKINLLENEYLAILEDNGVAFLILQNNNIVFVNKAFQSLFGFTSKEEVYKKKVKELFPPSSAKTVASAINAMSDNASSIEVQLLKNDGTLIDVILSPRRITFHAKPSLLISFVDTTKNSQLIRQLTSSEEHFREIINKSPEAVAVVYHNKIIFVNQQFASLFEYDDTSHCKDKEILTFVAEQQKEMLAEYLKKIEGGKFIGTRIECVGRTKENKEIDIELTASLLPKSSGKEVIIVCRDISEQKRLLSNLREQVEEVKRVDSLVSRISTDDVKKMLKHGLHELQLLHKCEYGISYLVNDTTGELELQESKTAPTVLSEKLSTLSLDHGIGGLLSKTQESHFYTLSKYPSYLPHRSLFEQAGFGAVGFIPLVAKERCVGLFVIGTKSKKFPLLFSQLFYALVSTRLGGIVGSLTTLSAVKELEEQFRTLAEVNSLVTYRLSPNGSLLYISAAVEQFLGYKPKEFYRNPSLWLSLVHPDDKKLLLNRIANLPQRDTRLRLEYRIRPKGKASYHWVSDELNIIRNEQSEEISFYGCVTDITEEKTTIEEIKKKATFDTDLLSSIDEGIVVFDGSLNCRYWNQGMVELTGIRKEQAMGKHVSEVFPSALNEERLKLIRKAFAGEETISDKLLLNVQHEKALTLWEHYTPLRTADGTIGGVVGMLRDVTSEKQLEQKLRDSEQLLSNLIDTMDDLLLVTDLKGTVLQVNRAFLNVMGYKRSQVVGLEFPYPWLLDEEMGRYVLWISSLREKSSLHDFDMTWKAKDGKLFSISMSTSLLRNSLGEPIALLNLARDISDRKRLTQQLEDRNKLVELINRINEVANQTMDFNTIFSQFSEEIGRIFSFDDLNFALVDEQHQSISIYAGAGISGSYVGRRFPLDVTVSQQAIVSRKPVVIDDLLEYQEHQTLASYEEGLRSQISIPILVKTRILGTLNIGSKNPHHYSKEDAEFLHSIAQQLGVIYDRVVLFKQVTDDVAYIHNLLDSIDSVVYTVDSQCRILEVNKAWYEFIRSFDVAEQREYHGMNLFDALPDEALKVMLQNVVEDLLRGTVRFFSQEYVVEKHGRREVYQVTINPMLLDRTITGLVITHTDISSLKQTEMELMRHNEQLLALHEISMLIRSTLDFNEVLNLAIPLLRKNVDARAILVYKLDQQGTMLTLVNQIGFEHIPASEIGAITLYGSATGIVVKNQEALFINEASYNDERILADKRELLSREHIESLAIIPLLAKGSVLGAICIFYTQPNVFTPHLKNILSLVGNQLGTALENARLYGELQSQVSRLTVLYELSERLTSTLEVDMICRLVLENTLRVVPYRKAVIALYEQGRENFDVAFQAEVNDEGWGIVKTQQPVQIDFGSMTDLTMKRKTSLIDVNHSKIYVPMVSKESLIGMMILESQPGEQYTSIHMKVIESISNLSAIALEKAELYQETIEKSLEIERRNKELDDFTYVVSHDLKEPLISVEGFSKILLADYGELIHAEGKEYLDSMVGATERMKKLIDDLLMLSRVSRPTESFKPLQLNQILQDIIRDLEFRLSKRNAEVIIQDNLPTVIGNETHMKIVFSNLISNAVKFNDKPRPLVEIGLQNTQNNMYLFYVRDNGIGIAKEFHEKIFMIFQRLHRREEYEGTGAGLAIVKKIIELHKGKIWVESELGKGSTFYFSLPKI